MAKRPRNGISDIEHEKSGIEKSLNQNNIEKKYMTTTVLALGKSHNSSWLRYLCQTRPPLPPQAFLKKFFAKAREFDFFTFFQLVSSFVMLISVVGHSTFAFAAPAHD